MILYNHQLRDYNFNIRSKKSHHKKDGGYSITRYCDDIIVFDIETTSAWLTPDNTVIGYEKGKSAEYWNNLTPLALPYIWQLSINDTVYYGRELTQIVEVLEDLPEDTHLIIWVHNLSFEFAFLAGILQFDKVFARTPHKPIYATVEDKPLIEFRCSYMLTRLSLDSWGKQIGVNKKSGDLDYNIIRTPLTPLTDKELTYCEYDDLVVYNGILDYVKRYGTQFDIPITQTGTVRREVKKRLCANDEYMYHIKKLVPNNAYEYKRLQQVFAGGYTHANRMYSGTVVRDVIQHYDFASSYPTVMICEKYPDTPWVRISDTIPDINMFENEAYIMHLRFNDIQTTSYNTYLQAYKCNYSTDAIFDNGRILSASYVETTITEQDYMTIIENYSYTSIEVLGVWQSHKDYLPKVFIDYILELYENKTRYKDVDGYEDIYLQSKQYINSLFGMSVTNIVQAEVIFNGSEWITEPLTEDKVNETLNKLKQPYKSNKKYFLNYSAGCYVTAYSRRNLWKCIHSIDRDVIYCDTDSIFCRGEQDFNWYNVEITEKLKRACDTLEIDFARTRPKTPKGKEKPLGIFDRESDCSEFITLGAKRYCERRTEDGALHLTISGINKDAVKLLENDITNFKDGFVFDKDGYVYNEDRTIKKEFKDTVKKKLCTYITDMPVVTYPDGYVSHYTHGINLRNNGYNLSLTDEYKTLIELCSMSVEELPEEYLIKMRGEF